MFKPGLKRCALRSWDIRRDAAEPRIHNRASSPVSAAFASIAPLEDRHHGRVSIARSGHEFRSCGCAIETSDAHIDRMNGAAAQERDDFITELLQLQTLLHD